MPRAAVLYQHYTMRKDPKMASKSKKASKAKAADKKVKFKVPKDIGGVKIPKELRREGDKLIEAIRFAITSQATAAAFTALSRLNTNPNRDRGCADR
jgi:hypothetical protein